MVSIYYNVTGDRYLTDEQVGYAVYSAIAGMAANGKWRGRFLSKVDCKKQRKISKCKAMFIDELLNRIEKFPKSKGIDPLALKPIKAARGMHLSVEYATSKALAKPEEFTLENLARFGRAVKKGSKEYCDKFNVAYQGSTFQKEYDCLLDAIASEFFEKKIA